MTRMMIGRFGGDIEQDNLAAVAFKGGDDQKVSVDGRLSAGPEDGRWLRDQLTGLVGADELVVPVWCATDMSWAGWYRVNDANVTVGPGGYVIGWWKFDADMERVASAADARIESILTGTVVANAHSMGTPALIVPWSAVPAAAAGWTWGGADVAESVRRSATGDVRWRTVPGVAAGVASWWVAPERAYDGACTLRVDGHVVTGRSMPSGRWTIDNGLVRVSPGLTDPAGRLVVEHWDDVNQQWEATRYLLGVASVSGDIVHTVTKWGAARVLRVTPERVSIRCEVSDSQVEAGQAYGRRWVDLTIDRGSYWVNGHAQASMLTGWTVAFETTTAIVATTNAGQTIGAQRSAFDTAGNKQILTTPAEPIIDTTRGSLTTASIGSMHFGISAQIAGSGTWETPGAQIAQFLHARGETIRVAST